MNIENLKKSFKELKPYDWIMAIIMIAIAASAMITAFIHPEMSKNPAWLTIINFISAICGVFCIFFCARANISNFAFGLINTLVYAVYLFYWRIWGTFALEMAVYLPLNIFSWIAWVRHRDNIQPEKTLAKKLTWQMDLTVGVIVIVSACIYHEILVRIGGTVPWLDAFTVAIGIIATILELLRYREQYWLWLITDVIAVAMFIVHFDPVYLTKKTIYLIYAVIGLREWARLQKTRNKENI